MQLQIWRRIADVARRHFPGPLLRNGGFTPATAQAALDEGSADAIVFGRAFIANPDRVARWSARPRHGDRGRGNGRRQLRRHMDLSA